MRQYINEIIIDNETSMSGNLRATYTVTLRRIDGMLFFSCHILYLGLIRLTNYQEIFNIEDEVVKNLMSKVTDISHKKYSIIMFFEFEKNVRFIPDIRILSYS